MKKFADGDACLLAPFLLKFARIMKLTALFMLFCALQVSAGGYSQTRISLKLEGVNLKKALSVIEKKSSYRFLYNQALLNEDARVAISAENEEVVSVLDKLLNNTPLGYEILDNYLVVLKYRGMNFQQTRVTGRITDVNGAPVPLASVKIKGSTAGTSADNDGNFAITVPENATLVISSIGFDDQEIVVGDKTIINVVLQPSTKLQDEVVVIGYGTAQKRDLTGSVAKVKGDELASQPNTNPLASMQAKVAGLSIVNNAIPGSTPDVRIRGTISIGTVRPVYIIDGIFSDNMDFVSPNEIESIEVLKDPSSLAVFGIRGAAGAILVTTKRAKAGQVNVNFSSVYGVKTLVDKIELANGDEYRQLATFEANNRVQDNSNDNSYLSFIDNIGGPGLSAYTGNTDWIDAVTRNAKFTTNNISVDGSSEKNRFHMGVGYTYDEGLVKHVKYDRINININDEYKINKIFKVGFNFIGAKENLPYNSGALENARRALPIIDSKTRQFNTRNPYFPDDSSTYNLYSNTPIIQNSEANPLAVLENEYDKRSDTRFRYVGSAFVDINITKDLNFRSTWYANISNRDERVYTPLYDVYDPTRPEGEQVIAKNNLTAVAQYQDNTKSFQQDYIGTYKKRFGDHSITATAGFTTFYNKFQSITGNISQETGGTPIPNDERFWYIQTGFGNIGRATSRSSQNEYSTVSGLARVLYNFQNKYYLNASFRRDGSSQINRDYKKKFQNFWAVGAAWEVTRENFMDGQDFFDYLKLKGSIGELGNFNSDRAYPAYPTTSTGSSAVFGTTLEPVWTEDFLVDPNLQWETVMSSEVGIEADFLDRRFHFEANYYYKKTEDLLVSLRYPGILPTLTNGGTIENKGFEFIAGWNQKLSNDMTLSLSGNLTTYKNKVLEMETKFRTLSSSEQTASQVEAGYPMGYFYGLVVEGVYQSYRDILLSPDNTINGGNARPGDLKYADLNGDGVITDEDRTNIGNPTPDFTYGANANLKYKNFDLGVDVAGVYGNEIYRVWGTSEQKNSVYNYPKNYLEGWTAPGSSNFIPIVNAAHLINRAPSTYGVEDGSYFRIRNVTLGYNFSQFKNSNIIKNLRIYGSVQNLKTWKNNLGYSPEFSGDATFWGVDFGGAGSALPRIVSVGLNANF
ncbi:TonB-dependent receptor [Flavihumibacter sp.]|uniref:TonB-dependent receptor n=1 Tax=Flavihumibacter sp. TaxID=1913981 RepID=UPI002FC5E0D7